MLQEDEFELVEHKFNKDTGEHENHQLGRLPKGLLPRSCLGRTACGGLGVELVVLILVGAVGVREQHVAAGLLHD